jgi:hypothetical protein
MKISLLKFETIISSAIVRRGQDYFYNDAVKSLRKLKGDKWVASVEGTEIYRVCIQLKDDVVYNHSCSCPYDMGPVCKHIIAVLYSFKKSVKLKLNEETFEQMISRIPRKDLNDILTDYAQQESEFAGYVSARCIVKKSSSDKEEYRQIIQGTVDAIRGRHGYIGYWQAQHAVGGAEMVLDKAREFLKKKKPEQALIICQCVLEEMVPLLQEADDSNGAIGDVIGGALQFISDCAQQAKKAEFRKDLLNYLLKECGDKRYEGWTDWRWEFLGIAGEVAKNPQDRQKLFARIDDIENNYSYKGDWSRYDHERATIIKMRVVERLGTKEEADEFLYQNLDCAALREYAIESARKQKDYILAKKLALEGLNQSEFPGPISRWTEHLLNIAEVQKDISSVKKYAIERFLDSNDFTYYDRYKKCFTAKEWPQEVQKIIDIIKCSKDSRNYVLVLPQLYIRQELWSDLMDYVQKSNNSWALENFTKYLKSHFPDKLADIYEKVIVEDLAPLMGRGNYQYLCKFLKGLKNLGYKERMECLVIELSEKYRNRRAMLEELSKV